MAVDTSCGLAAKPVSKAPVQSRFMARNAGTEKGLSSCFFVPQRRLHIA